jgi:23S rRNA pseudouridine1911/1915/1917 synthase
MPLLLNVPEEEDSARLDAFVARAGAMSRARASALLDAGVVLVNDNIERKSYRVASGDVITVGDLVEEIPLPPEGVELVFEDDDLMVVFKPSGVVTHGAPGMKVGTLVDALQAKGRPLAPRAGTDRPGIVHRLDRDVSGLLVVAKTDRAHEALVTAMAAREIDRRYLAVVVGVVETDKGKIDAPIGRSAKQRTKMAVMPDGKHAVTWFAVRERYGEASLLEVRLETGRTHQIRTHLQAIGHPIVGDVVYGRDHSVARSLQLGRPFLHAFRLSFDHPIAGERRTFESALPADLADPLERLRRAS